MRAVRYLLLPLRPVPLALVAVFTIGFLLALRAGFMGLPLFLILFSWLWKYAFVLLDATSRGLPPPVLSIEMVNPWGERRPLGLLALAAVGVGLVGLARRYGGELPASALAAALLIALPAATAVLTVSQSWLEALSPLALAGVIRGLGRWYVAIVAFALAAAGAAWTAYGAWPEPLAIGAAQLLLLALYALIGGALYERRDELGIEAWESPERSAARADADAAHRDDAILDEIYRHVRVRKPELGYAVAERWLGERRRTPEACAWLRERAAGWEDRRIADRLTRELVSRLIALGRAGDALLEVERWWARGGSYVPSGAKDLVRLIEVARRLRRAASAERLLAEHAALFPHDLEVRAALPKAPGDPTLPP